MNDVIKCLCERRSTKAFKDDMIPKDVLDRIVKAGTYAANGRGWQSPTIIVVTDRAMRDRLSKMNAEILGTNSDPFYGAPVVCVVLADKQRPTHIYDGSLVMGNLMNAAHSEGVGSCWIHRAKEEFESPEGKEILKELGIEGDLEGIGHCVLGYPVSDEQKIPAPRKEDYVYYV